MRRVLSQLKLNVPCRSPSRLRSASILVAGLVWFAPPVLRAAAFTATLDRNTITLGESATLSLTFADGSPQNVPEAPAIANLQIAYIGPSSQVSFINGQVSSTVTHNYTVTPVQAGEFTIPAVTAEVSGEKLSTQPLKLRVLKPGAPPPQAINSGAQLAFLKLLVPKKEVYLGETITAELQLYAGDRVQRISGFQLAAFPTEGFTVSKMVEGQHRQVQIGNGRYTMIPLTMTLKPVKTGPLAVGPVTASVVVDVPSSNRQQDPFERFGFRGMLDIFGSEQRRVALAAEAETVQSLALPSQNVPPTFNGAVGSYTMSVSAGPTNVGVGDPITVRVQISGRGALDALALPDQPGWQEFKTYPPTTKLDTTDAHGLQGTKTFEQVIVPQSAEIKELPPVSFSFFDPDQKRYRTLTQPAVALVVRPSGSASAPTIVAAARGGQENAPPTQDIVPIKQRMGTVAQISPPLIQQPWFIALQGLPALAWISALVWRRRTESLANNPRLRRQRQVAQLVRDGVIGLRQLAAGKKSEEFFAALFRLLQEQLGERLDLPASAITEAVIEEHLRPRAVPDATLAALHELFQTCNLARYAPIKTSQELAAMIPKLESVLRELQGLKT